MRVYAQIISLGEPLLNYEILGYACQPKGRIPMPDKRIALVTGANQGVGLQVAKELVANGLTVLVGSRNLERGEAAAKEIGPGAIALQLDVTDRVSICRRGGAHP